MGANGLTSIHLVLPDGAKSTLSFSKTLSCSEVLSALKGKIKLDLNEPKSIKLYSPEGHLIPIGPNIPGNNEQNGYRVVAAPLDTTVRNPATDIPQPFENSDVSTCITAISHKLDLLEKYTTRTSKVKGIVHTAPCIARLEKTKKQFPKEIQPSFSKDEIEQLKTTSMDMWKYSELELMYLLSCMFDEFGLLQEFNISRDVLIRFLNMIRDSYNDNPFHNFKHCFCVTQMVFDPNYRCTRY